MPRATCDRCGNTYISEDYLDRHLEKGDCEPRDSASDDSTETTAGSNRRSEIDYDKITGRVTGMVTHYDEDGGYGFVTTADLTHPSVTGDRSTRDVFFHISDIQGSSVEEGDRLEFDIVPGDEGPRCDRIEIIKRAGNHEVRDREIKSRRRHGFGHQVDDTKYGPGRSGPSEQKIESFRNERKFR